MLITTDCKGSMFSLSRIALMYSSMSLVEMKSRNTSKDEIIFIRNDITLMDFIITEKS